MKVLETSRFFFFFKQKTAYELRISDWSSDVCSSDLQHLAGAIGGFRNGMLLDDIPSVMQLAGDTLGQREGFLEGHQPVVTMNKSPVVEFLQPGNGVEIALRLGPVDENVAHRREGQRPWRETAYPLEQGQQR